MLCILIFDHTVKHLHMSSAHTRQRKICHFFLFRLRNTKTNKLWVLIFSYRDKIANIYFGFERFIFSEERIEVEDRALRWDENS